MKEQENMKEQESKEEQESKKEQEIGKELKDMKELIEYVAKSIVNAPDDVVVTEEETERGLTFKLQVNDEDKGRIIGKQGRVAEAMRTLLRVKAAKAGSRASLEIV